MPLSCGAAMPSPAPPSSLGFPPGSDFLQPDPPYLQTVVDPNTGEFVTPPADSIKNDWASRCAAATGRGSCAGPDSMVPETQAFPMDPPEYTDRGDAGM